MAHRRRTSRGFEKVIDETRWGGSNSLFAAQAQGSAALVFITGGQQETILRIRGELVAYLDAEQAPGVLVQVGIGALVVQEGSGTTVIQTPLNDPEAPWLFYERFTLGYEEAVTNVIAMPGLSVFRKEIDSKAMRILREGREVQLVLHNLTLLSGASINVSFNSRVLLGQK